MSDLAPVASAGDRLASLRVLRDVLARQIDMTDSGRDVAALSARFTDVLDRIATLEAGAPDANKGTALDEFTKRRTAREAAGAAGPAKRQQRR